MQRRCSSIVGLIVATRKGESPGNLAIFGVENLWIVEEYMIDIYIYIWKGEIRVTISSRFLNNLSIVVSSEIFSNI